MHVAARVSLEKPKTQHKTVSTPTAAASRSEFKLLVSTILRSIRTIAIGIAGYIQEQRRSRATCMAVRNLDEHMLRDIGLSRSNLVDLNSCGRDR